MIRPAANVRDEFKHSVFKAKPRATGPRGKGQWSKSTSSLSSRQHIFSVLTVIFCSLYQQSTLTVWHHQLLSLSQMAVTFQKI